MLVTNEPHIPNGLKPVSPFVGISERSTTWCSQHGPGVPSPVHRSAYYGLLPQTVLPTSTFRPHSQSWPLRFTSSGMNSRYAISSAVDFITTRNTLLTLQGCEEPSRQPKTFLLYLVPLLSRSRG